MTKQNVQAEIIPFPYEIQKTKELEQFSEQKLLLNHRMEQLIRGPIHPFRSCPFHANQLGMSDSRKDLPFRPPFSAHTSKSEVIKHFQT